MKHRGMGRVFQSSYTDKKTGKLRKSARWHIEFWVNGKPQREKTGSVQQADAVKLLKRRTGEAAIGKLLRAPRHRDHLFHGIVISHSTPS